MIISVSRRTDIPAHYSTWFMNRVRAGYCLVPNPFNAKRMARVSLAPEDVDAFVFWTKNPAPLLCHLRELDERGFAYYFQCTLTGYDATLEPGVPPPGQRIDAFLELAAHVGPDRVIWRYDPIILGNVLTVDYHEEEFRRLAGLLEGATSRVMISVVDFYQKTIRRLGELKRIGMEFEHSVERSLKLLDLLSEISKLAAEAGMEIFSCAEKEDYTSQGIRPGRCVDGELVMRLTGKATDMRKDPFQRKACGCVVSRDIGVNDTCIHGCAYCYATRNDDLARRRYAEHDPVAETLWRSALTGPPGVAATGEQLALI